MKEEMAGEKMENEITKKVPKDGAKGQMELGNPVFMRVSGLLLCDLSTDWVQNMLIEKYNLL